MNKKLAAIGLTVGVATGGVAGLVFGAPGVSNAVTSATVAAVADTTATESTAPTDETRPDRAARLAEILAPLVSEGTITQAQADSVIAALDAAGPMGGGHRGGRRPGLDAAATALGMTEDELRTELRAGSSVAEIAAATGVEIQTVIDAMVASATERINEKVADGSITQAQADERLATIEAQLTSMVNGELPDGGRGRRRGHHDEAAEATGTEVDPATATTVG